MQRFSDYAEAARSLVAYVEQHRLGHPGIENQVALIELDEDERRTRGFLLYEDLVRQVRHTAGAI
jgi:hypothetical protein